MAENGTKAVVKFNFRALTAGDMHLLNKALREVDVPTAANIMAKIVQECPKEWGAPTEPQTFMNLPYFGEFQDLVDEMSEQAKNVRKK